MGLIRGLARTAAIAGTATAVSNHVSRRPREPLGATRPIGVRPTGVRPAGPRSAYAPAPAPVYRARAGGAVAKRHTRSARETGPAPRQRRAHRRGIRSTESEDSRHLTIGPDRSGRVSAVCDHDSVAPGRSAFLSRPGSRRRGCGPTVRGRCRGLGREAPRRRVHTVRVPAGRPASRCVPELRAREPDVALGSRGGQIDDDEVTRLTVRAGP